MRYPEFIKPGGRIGFIAPSFGCGSIEPYFTRFKYAVKYFEEKGYRTVTGPNVMESTGLGKSNTADKCGDEINEFFTSDNCDCIISAGGGETMCEDLGYVDFEAIKEAAPKWFLGYSDNTCLTFTLPVLCDTAAIYGPCASSFGMQPAHEYLNDTFKLLTGEKLEFSNYPAWEIEGKSSEETPLATVNATEPYSQKLYKDGELYLEDAIPDTTVSGRMIGGCLDVLSCLCGTKYDKAADFAKRYKDDGIIWFLESCDLNPFSIFRTVWQLDAAGWFENAKGFVFGRPMHFNESAMEMDNYNAVLGILKNKNVPIIFDADLGHLPPQIPVISGALANIHAAGNKLEIEYILK